MSGRIEGYENCNGCGVCTLPCPIWQQRHDALLTFAGRARALQAGAGIEELRESVDACLLCGSCEPVCAMGVQTLDVTLKLRAMLNGGGQTLHTAARQMAPAASGHGLLLPGPALRGTELLDRITVLLGIDPAEDDGSDLIAAFEAGTAPPEERTLAFLRSLGRTGRVVAADGLFKRYLRVVSPGLRVEGLGEALLRLESIQAALGPTDLYIIEARAYNMDFAHCMPFYTGVSRRTGCGMNLDLQRVAIPTGLCGDAGSRGAHAPDSGEQLRWIFEGRGFDRVVVEAVEDMAALRTTLAMPVVHVAELAGGGPAA